VALFNGEYGVRNQITCSCFNQKWYFAPRFLKLYSFRALGTGRRLTAITRQRVAYFLKTALLFVAQGLLDTLISVIIFFGNDD